MSHNSNFSMATNSAESSSPSVAVAVVAAATAEPAATWVSLKLVAIPAPPQPKRAYTCAICAKPFPTPQALGGHRNGHRKELNDMLMRYVQRRLEAARNIAATAALNGEIEHPPRRNRATKNSGGGGGRGRGRGRGRANRKTVETAAPSLELSLAIGGKSKRKNSMAYKYPEVLLPDCHVPKRMDLTLKL